MHSPEEQVPSGLQALIGLYPAPHPDLAGEPICRWVGPPPPEAVPTDWT